MNNIVLIGFMGCGKSTFGKWLARAEKRKFIDTDDYIEELEGKKIKDIFAQEGEEYFRQLETKALKKLLDENTDMVLAVGGGLPVRKENRELLKNEKTVYLRATIDTLEKRLKGDTKRPLLAGGNVREKIATLMEKRSDIYEETADVIIDTDDLRFEDIYDLLKQNN